MYSGWIASMSDGQTVFETERHPGELSPWQMLLERCRKQNIRITQLRLQRGGVTVVALPHADGYFQAYESRTSGRTLKTTTVQGIGSIVGKQVYITWLNDQGHVWQDVRPLGELWVHTDLRQLVDLI